MESRGKFMDSAGFNVMTFNVGNDRTRPEELVKLCRASDLSIIGLQELTDRQAQFIGRELQDIFPYQTLYGEGIPGKGLLSRYPITEVRQLHLYHHRPDLLGVVEVAGKLLRVIVVHPLPPRFHRKGLSFTEDTHLHVANLTELASSGEPTLLMGDFNMLNWDKRHARLSQAGLVDVFKQVGQGYGHTLPRKLGAIRAFPFMRVDYIWITRHLTPLAAWVGPYSGSDHLPVMARLQWLDRPNKN